jgi:hypothetical protein
MPQNVLVAQGKTSVSIYIIAGVNNFSFEHSALEIKATAVLGIVSLWRILVK